MSPRALAVLLLATASIGASLRAQAPDVPVENEGAFRQRVSDAAESLKEAGKLQSGASLAIEKAPARCALQLPVADTRPLAATEVYQRARKATLNIGRLYLCTRCEKWHTNLAGGYAITADGVAATCYHVIAEKETVTREDYLIAVDAEGNAYAVTAILAANKAADVAIVRTEARDRTPLPLNRNGRPGDPVFCLSNPKSVQGLFTTGQIARYFAGPGRRVFLNVTCDWAAGSSGAAVLDQSGNALGHVASTRTLLWRDAKPAPKDVQMVLKQASSAQEVLKLVE